MSTNSGFIAVSTTPVTALKRILPLCLLFVATRAFGATIGDPVIVRPNADLATQITFINVASTPSSPGFISKWDLYADNTGPISLQAYRPAGGGYLLLGQNDVTVSGSGLQEFTIPQPQQIPVQPGDLIGFHYGANTQIIDFDFGTGDTIWTSWPNPSSLVPVGSTLDLSQFSAGNLSPQRLYSFSATISAVPEPASFSLLAVCSATFLRRRNATTMRCHS